MIEIHTKLCYWFNKHFIFKEQKCCWLESQLLLSCENRVELVNEQDELISFIGQGEKCLDLDSEVMWFQ